MALAAAADRRQSPPRRRGGRRGGLREVREGAAESGAAGVTRALTVDARAGAGAQDEVGGGGGGEQQALLIEDEGATIEALTHLDLTVGPAAAAGAGAELQEARAEADGVVA